MHFEDDEVACQSYGDLTVTCLNITTYPIGMRYIQPGARSCGRTPSSHRDPTARTPANHRNKDGAANSTAF